MPTIAPDAAAPYAPARPADAPTHSPPGTPTYMPPPAPAPWPLPLRIGFRFAAAWLVLVNDLLGPALGQLPGLSWLVGKYAEVRAPLLTWVGAHVLHTAAPAVELPNGAGDKTVFWVGQLVTLVLAVAIAAVWSVLDRRRTEYRKAHDWLRVYVRYALGVTMLGYGAFKVIKLQFPAPTLTALLRPYGESSPMGILWKLMGHSYGYNLFTGLAEAVPAAMLFWRRTTTLGALLLVAALANVFALNMAYDVTVKGYSLELLLMAGFLLLPELRRLWDVLVLHRAVPAQPLGEPFARPGLRRAARVLHPLVALYLIATPFWGAWRYARQGGAEGPPVPLFGIYEVESFQRNGMELPPLTTDPVRWRRFVVDRRGAFTVQAMSDSLLRYRGTVDTAAARIAFAPMTDSTRRTVLHYVREEGDRLRIAGVSGTDSIAARLRRVDHTRFTLLARDRQFHWVQDDNFNR